MDDLQITELAVKIAIELQLQSEPKNITAIEKTIANYLESLPVDCRVMPNEVLAGGLTDKQKTIISIAVLEYLKTSTRIIDKDGKEYPDFIIDKIYNSPGLDYFLDKASQREA
jgi:hypothetical protein